MSSLLRWRRRGSLPGGKSTTVRHGSTKHVARGGEHYFAAAAAWRAGITTESPSTITMFTTSAISPM